MVKLLLSRKADVSRKDHLGNNCLDWAIDNNQRFKYLCSTFHHSDSNKITGIMAISTEGLGIVQVDCLKLRFRYS